MTPYAKAQLCNGIAVCAAISSIFMAQPTPQARADDIDRIFLQVLAENHVSCGTDFDCPNGPDSIVTLAHALCAARASGRSDEWVISTLVSTPGNKVMTSSDAACFLGASEAAYCEQYAPSLSKE